MGSDPDQLAKKSKKKGGMGLDGAGGAQNQHLNASEPNSLQNQLARRRAIVPTDDQVDFKNKQQKFEKELKLNKSKFALPIDETYRSLVK